MTELQKTRLLALLEDMIRFIGANTHMDATVLRRRLARLEAALHDKPEPE